ncbi:hypothetical protein [Fulvivirga lutimaris]|uniref:hypothetical protein n=1 Tax=Fulvivirga lutimaris TaxID=1819566 RepID=UPI0012BC2EB2|nr:hypothetical protein [Fulvivirga lutimaris]MTI38123.1 hypothetical protein [Fulvivirga lutimaris]
MQNKLSVNQLKLSEKITESLGLSGDIVLKQTDIDYKLSLGYAAPFIIAHDENYYEVVEEPVNVEINNSLLKFVKVPNSETNNVSFIVSNLFQTYVHDVNNLYTTRFLADSKLTFSAYRNNNYSSYLSVAVPPPRV